MEQQYHSDHGWDREGAAMAVVYSELFDEDARQEASGYMPPETIAEADDAESSGVISLKLMTELPELVQVDPYVGLPTMVDLMVEDVFQDQVEWLQAAVSAPGFVGFAFLLNEQQENETGGRERRQRLLFSSSTHGVFVVHRADDGSQVEHGWMPTCALSKEDRIMLALVKLNDVSHMLRSLLAYQSKASIPL
jgi:hypothetical protein